MKKIKKQLLLFSFVLFMGFVLCSAASAVQYADVAVDSIDCAVSSDGTTAEFSINIENKGTITAQNVILRDKMAGVDVSQSQYSINNGPWQEWNKHYINLGTMTAGQTMLIEFKAPITSNTLINKAELTTTTPEFNRYNNRLSYTTQANYTITSTAGTGGTINPDGNTNVIKGQSTTFTITPNTGYYINDVTVDGTSQGAITSYTFNNVQTNHTIAATFNRITYTITPSAGTGGTINPNTPQTINHGDNITFNITPNTGYYINDVTVDGTSQGAITSYTFNNVQANHTIAATFSRITYTITPSAGTGGTINPNTPQTVNHGDDITFNITPNTGWQITDVIVDGSPQGAITSYTFNNVQTNHTIAATFHITQAAYVNNFYSDNVSVIDTTTNTVITTIPVGDGPREVMVNPDGTKAYIPNYYSNSVSVIDTTTNTVTAFIPVGICPIGVAVSPDGTRAYVVNEVSCTVSVIDTTTNTVTTTIHVGFSPWGIAVSPDGTRAYVANQGAHTISVIDTITNTVTTTIPVGWHPCDVTVSPDGTRAYVTINGSNSASVIDTTTNTVITTIPVGDGPVNVAVSPDGTRAYVTNRYSNSVSVIDTSTNTVIATIGVGSLPYGVAVSPDGTRTYITNYFSNSVSVIDTTTNTVTTTITVGDGPRGVAVSP